MRGAERLPGLLALNLVYSSENPISVEATGTGRLLGVDNGDQNDPTPLCSRTKKAHNGQLLVLLQAGRSAGHVELTLTEDGLEPARLVVTVGQ